jgi:hypothetical protein
MELRLQTYWLVVCVDLHVPVHPEPGQEDDDPRPDVGYVQDFGVTAASEEEASDLVVGLISDGDICWSDSTVALTVVEHLHPEIIARAGDWTEKGIWYKSGRAFFPADSE